MSREAGESWANRCVRRSPEDSEYEVACMSPGIGTLDAFPSIWGHWAGGPGDSVEDVKWLDEHLRRFFSDSAEATMVEKLKL